ALGFCTIACFICWRLSSSSPSSASLAAPDVPSDGASSSSSPIGSTGAAGQGTRPTGSALDPAASALLHELLDSSQPVKSRREKARALAKLGSEQSIAALRAALQDGEPYLKAAIGEGLGESPHPEATALLLEMVQGSDETAARGAIRG